ncbi:peptidase inhibitor family I36 protein [Amycolatopsis keratiniphila]|uniref:Peptidase inhibitor family I36 n=1 Tax=Amycolatopsis keratiniphila TaxID=129921 RepID=R4SX74_9PSEU|nr:peptidase inhibitor family I36 protein [Amycolatopsis keratiniphila]AGM07909.1 hypothetical protein AORI_5326 [Amycolatopsis keratiniphila]
MLPLTVMLSVATALTPIQTGSPAAPDCGFHEICVWSGTDYTGTKAFVESVGTPCLTASSLGLPAIRSVDDNHEYKVVTLFSDTACAVAATPHYVGPTDSARSVTPAARSVQLMPLPSVR